MYFLLKMVIFHCYVSLPERAVCAPKTLQRNCLQRNCLARSVVDRRATTLVVPGQRFEVHSPSPCTFPLQNEGTCVS